MFHLPFIRSRLVPIVSTAVLCITSAPVAAATDGTASDRAAIAALLDAEAAAWKAGDADAFAAHVTPDVVFTNIVGAYSVGKQPFVAQHRMIFSTIYRGSEVAMILQHIAFVRPDVAVVDVISRLTGPKEAPSGATLIDGRLYTRLEQVMVRTGEAWSVSAFHNVTIQPRFFGDEARALAAPNAE